MYCTFYSVRYEKNINFYHLKQRSISMSTQIVRFLSKECLSVILIIFLQTVLNLGEALGLSEDECPAKNNPRVQPFSPQKSLVVKAMSKTFKFLKEIWVVGT